MMSHSVPPKRAAIWGASCGAGMAGLTNIGIKNAADGKLYDAGGLMLVKRGEAGKWLWRYSHLTRRREMGLGSWPEVGLAEVRKTRDQWAAILRSGKDPVTERERQRIEEQAALDRTDPTFSEMVDIVFEAKRAGLRGDGKRGRWRSPLDLYVIPKIGRKRMSALMPIEVRDALSPIWKSMHPTAIKALNRTRIVFREARLMGYEADPFTVAAAERMLGEHHHVAKHIPATPWREMPGLYAKVNGSLSSDRCLCWIMLTCVRADAARGARVSEVSDGVWTVPAARVKGRLAHVTEFRVPLSAPALAMVEENRRLGLDLMFPGLRMTSPVTDRALERRLDNLGEAGRPHGFRSSFRSWVQDTDSCSWDVAEMILGHRVGSKIERTYARSDMLERRRPVMEAWARFMAGEASAEVVPLRR